MSQHRIACYKCQFTWDYEPPLTRRSECPKCRSDAKVCLNCRYYDPSAHHECREEQAEWVKEKGQGNFCSYFASKAEAQGSGAQDKARAKLDQLFQSGTAEPVKTGGSLAEELARFLGGKK